MAKRIRGPLIAGVMVDGCSGIRLPDAQIVGLTWFFEVRPFQFGGEGVNGLITVGLVSFVGAWNNFFLPLLVLSNEDLLPLTVGMAVWNQSSVMTGGQPVYTVIAMGSILSVLPLLVAFVLFGRYWRSGLTSGGVK